MKLLTVCALLVSASTCLLDTAAGSEQSPIKVDPRVAVFSTQLASSPLLFSYPALSQCSLSNSGHSFTVAVENEVAQFQGGPLPGPYRFAQYHMHWGSTDAVGSEHSMGDHFYPAELHLVHWNAAKYASFNEASTKKDGLSVLGVFVQIGAANAELAKVLSKFDSINQAGTKVKLGLSVSLSGLLPGDKSLYYTYPGSLTTSPFSESVRWIVFPQPITMSHDQLNRLRNLQSSHGGRLVNNFRNRFPLGTRTLHVSKRV